MTNRIPDAFNDGSFTKVIARVTAIEPGDWSFPTTFVLDNGERILTSFNEYAAVKFLGKVIEATVRGRFALSVEIPIVDIWLDDERPEPPGWLRALTAEQATDFLTFWAGQVRCISLDNDLGENTPEGRTVVLWLATKQMTEEKDYWPESLHIHTANPVARDYMRYFVERYGPYGKFNFSRNGFTRN